jgi:hypothetical protein
MICFWVRVEKLGMPIKIHHFSFYTLKARSMTLQRDECKKLNTSYFLWVVQNDDEILVYAMCFLWKGQDTLFGLDNRSPQDNRSPSPTCGSHWVLIGLPFKNLALFYPRLKPSSMGSARCFHIKADWYLLTLPSQLCQLSICVVSFCLSKSLSKLIGIENIVCGVKVISIKKVPRSLLVGPKLSMALA